jgi:RimJ/RimL family protein N-acetyltransferase
LPIRTARLELRPWKVDDAAVLARIRDDQEIAHRTPVGQPFSIRAAREWIEQRSGAWIAGSSAAFAMVRSADRQPIGEIQLTVLSWPDRSAEVAYAVEAAARRRGYAAEALAGLTDAATHDLGLRRIAAEVEPDNVASRGALLRAGYGAAGVTVGGGMLNHRVIDLERFVFTARGAAEGDG